MHAVRRLVLRNSVLAAWLLAFALLVRVLVPAGYMPMATGTGIAVMLCPGSAPLSKPLSAALTGDRHGAHAGNPHADHHGPNEQQDYPATGGTPCAFAGLTAPSLGGADPALLVAAIAFVMATAAPRPDRGVGFALPRPRPPSQGPPVTV